MEEVQENNTQQEQEHTHEEHQEDTHDVQTQDVQSQDMQSQQEQSQQESDKEKNFRALREKAEQADREKQELQRQLNEIYAEQQRVARQQQQAQQQEEPEYNVRDTDYVEGRAFNSKIKRLEQQMKNYESATRMQQAERNLIDRYPDFNKVVTMKNVKKLKEEHPALAKVLGDARDIEAQGDSAYNMIKRFGIYKDEYARDKKMAQNNSAKPKNTSTANPQSGNTPMSNANAFANGLTPELKAKLRREMREASKKR